MLDQVSFGHFLSQKRKEMELTQEMVAEITGLSVRTIRNFETASTMPPLDGILCLCDLYSIDAGPLNAYYIRDPVMAYALQMYHIRTEYDRRMEKKKTSRKSHKNNPETV